MRIIDSKRQELSKLLNAAKQNECVLSLYGTVMACSSTCCIGCRKEFKLKNFGFTDVHPARFVLFQVDIDSFFSRDLPRGNELTL